MDCNPLLETLQLMLSRVSQDLGAILEGIRALSGELGVLSVGTACSGTDSPLLGIKALKRAFQGEFDFKYDHAFATELSAQKRRFIARAFPELTRIFSDVAFLGDGMALNMKGFEDGKNVLGSQRILVPPVRLFIAGVSCKAIGICVVSLCIVYSLSLVFSLFLVCGMLHIVGCLSARATGRVAIEPALIKDAILRGRGHCARGAGGCIQRGPFPLVPLWLCVCKSARLPAQPSTRSLRNINFPNQRFGIQATFSRFYATCLSQPLVWFVAPAL